MPYSVMIIGDTYTFALNLNKVVIPEMKSKLIFRGLYLEVPLFHIEGLKEEARPKSSPQGKTFNTIHSQSFSKSFPRRQESPGVDSEVLSGTSLLQTGDSCLLGSDGRDESCGVDVVN